MTGLWRLKNRDREMEAIKIVREYGFKIVSEMGPVRKQRTLNDDESDTQNAIDEQEWCQTNNGK